MATEYTAIDCTFLTESAKAVLVEIDGAEHWIPKSTLACEGDDVMGLDRGEDVELSVADWKLYDLGI